MMPHTSSRGPQRRKDDFDRDVGRWAMMVSVHRGKIMAAISILSVTVTWLATTAGYKYTGPGQEIAKLAIIVDTLKNKGQRTDSTMIELLREVKFIRYNQCLQMRAGDKYAQPTCLADGAKQ